MSPIIVVGQWLSPSQNNKVTVSECEYVDGHHVEDEGYVFYRSLYVKLFLAAVF